MLDLELLRLTRAQGCIDRRIGAILNKILNSDMTINLGFSKIGDYSIERLGISGRSATAMRSVASTCDNLPTVARAVDAGQLSARQAQLIGRVASPEDVLGTERWIDFASQTTLRELELQVQLAQDQKSTRPPDRVPEPGTLGMDGDDVADWVKDSAGVGDDEQERICQTLPVTLQQEAVWRIARDLVARIEGRPVGIDETVEALVGEYLSSATPAELSLVDERAPSPEQSRDSRARPPSRGWGFGGYVPAADRPRIEAWLEGHTVRWYYLAQNPDDVPDEPTAAPEPALESEAVSGPATESWSERLLATVHELPDPEALPSDPRELDRLARQLARWRQLRAWRLGRYAHMMRRLGLWRDALYLSFGHYVKERLGLGERTVQQRIWLDRRCMELPELAEAYRAGEIGYEQARLVAKIATETTCPMWMARAAEVTCQDLERQVQEAERLDAFTPLWATPEPPPMGHAHGDAEPEMETGVETGAIGDAQMCAGETGGSCDAQMCAGETEASGEAQMCAGETRLDLRLRLPAELWHVFDRAITLVRLRAQAWLSDAECFLTLVEHFRQVWSAPELLPTENELFNAVAERDGWVCSAPGCTCRRNLTVHHIQFRSQGGGDEPTNVTLVCFRHHLEGIHAGRVRVSGQAPGALDWEMGIVDGEPLWRVSEGRLLS
jgi:hypothetical protein